MEAKNADLAALRINRSPEATEAGPAGRARRWLLIGLPTAAILVVGAVFVITGGALSAALPVRLTPAANRVNSPSTGSKNRPIFTPSYTRWTRTMSTRHIPRQKSRR